MRLLHLLASPVWSGPADLIATLAQAQRRLGHQVHVAVDTKRARTPAEEPIAHRLRELELLDEGGLELSVKSRPFAILRDLATLRRRPVDLLHSHFSHDHLIARFGRPSGALLVRSLHAERSLRRGLPRADGFTVPTAHMLGMLAGRRAMVLPALVGEAFTPPLDRAALRRELGLEGAPLLGMVSTFKESRRHPLALAALPQVVKARPGARLVLVGDGADEAALRIRTEREPLLRAHVTFAGYKSGAQFVRYLQALDEVWILGLGNDHSARAAAQARACGVRVIAVNEGALGEYADVLVDRPEPDAVAQAALSSQRRAVDLLTPAQIAERVLAFYESCR